ncbi:ABC1-domain-containing protein [Rhizophagus clarus]|uniref:ABC1-domain-containing protein n=1 Tax=Rhizophagus clarus TaxID=94130 RepID=A0A8H3LR35_9GLOM|nr:ABC1-domain-containing protein [Rhizophagus clarus]
MYPIFYKDSIVIKNWFRIENSCHILSIIPFHFSFLPILFDKSDLNENKFINTPKVNKINEIHRIESSPNLIKKCLNYIYNLISDYIVEPILISCRFTYLLCIFLPLIIGSPLILLGKKVPECNNERTGTLWWYNRLMRSMEMAGPTFIKLGQWAASRTDIFPQEMCIRLSKLHSAVDPHPFYETKEIIEKAFNKPFEEIFISFDMDPIGIGAIAQVYKAVIRPEVLPRSFFHDEFDDDSGEHRPPMVAIKILHPSSENNIRRDLKILMVFAKIINAIPTMQWLSLPEEVKIFGEMMQSQLDLRIEATNLLEFQKNFNNRRTVKFPKPLMLYTTKNMLIEEYERGINVKLFLDNGAGVFNNMIANMGLDAFLHMLILDNFVHADLHPGNIKVKFTKQNTYNILRQFWINYTSTDEQKAKIRYDDRESDIAVERLLSKRYDKTLWLDELKNLCNEGYLPQLIFLDTGLVTSLNDENRKNFLDLFRAIAQFNGYEAGKLMIDRCKTPNLVIDGEIFALKMQHLVLSVKSLTLQLGKIKISDILVTVLHMVRQHHVKLEGDFVNVVISILLLEGIGRQLDPTMDLLKSALPILRELGSKGAGKGVLEGIKDIPGGGGLWLKVWIWLEAREWVDNASWNYYATLFHRYIWWPDI